MLPRRMHRRMYHPGHVSAAFALVHEVAKAASLPKRETLGKRCCAVPQCRVRHRLSPSTRSEVPPAGSSLCRWSSPENILYLTRIDELEGEQNGLKALTAVCLVYRGGSKRVGRSNRIQRSVNLVPRTLR
ncbi:hypothetical protein OH77DRAFT_7904 [Trametes cingulata]|nr:hypothetical protein OH77DRAFT_7904 [Trametes cingulata]